MIISQKYKITFLKNPKTAGTSIHETLSGINLIDVKNKIIQKEKEIDRKNINGKTLSVFTNQYYGKTEFRPSLDYLNLQFYLDQNIISENIEEYTNYVVIREPIDRFESLCRHVRSYPNVIGYLFEDKFNAVSKEETDKFKKYNKDDAKLKTLSSKFLDFYNSISLQEIGERIVEAPFNTIPRLDFVRIPQIYYYEDPRVIPLDYAKLQEEITALCERHNTLRRYILPKVNVGTKLIYDSLSQDLINKVRLIYAEDVEFYEKLISKSLHNKIT